MVRSQTKFWPDRYSRSDVNRFQTNRQAKYISKYPSILLKYPPHSSIKVADLEWSWNQSWAKLQNLEDPKIFICHTIFENILVIWFTKFDFWKMYVLFIFHIKMCNEENTVHCTINTYSDVSILSILKNVH